MDQTTRYHFSKKSLPIIISISAFSILYTFSFLPINDFSNQMRSYIGDRNYIFLFFNGILVLIIKSSIKSSGLANNSSPSSDANNSSPSSDANNSSPSSDANISSPSSETKHEFVEKRVDQVQPLAELAKNKADYREVVIVESEEEQVRAYESLGEEEKEDEYGYECDDEAEDDFFVIENEGFGLLSTEELNKKCDDFIRKMREGIKIQA